MKSLKLLRLLGLGLTSVFMLANFTLAPATTAAAATGEPSTVQSTTLERISQKAKSSWPYYISRASGLVAVALLFLLIFLGIGLYTGFTYRFMEPLTAWKVHRAIGISLGAAVCVHIFVLLFDTYIGFNLIQLLVPFVSDSESVKILGINFGSLYLALGILAFYLTLVVIGSSLLWRDTKPRLWRLLHFSAYLLLLFTFIHALYLGTDLKHGLAHYLWLAGIILLVLAILLRLKHARTIRQ